MKSARDIQLAAGIFDGAPGVRLALDVDGRQVEAFLDPTAVQWMHDSLASVHANLAELIARIEAGETLDEIAALPSPRAIETVLCRCGVAYLLSLGACPECRQVPIARVPS